MCSSLKSALLLWDRSALLGQFIAPFTSNYASEVFFKIYIHLLTELADCVSHVVAYYLNNAHTYMHARVDGASYYDACNE